MTLSLSPNTQAILLLTAPLMVGRGASQPDLLSPSEYMRLARHLRENDLQPADLILSNAQKALSTCKPVMDEDRLKKLLGRGLALSLALDHWHSRAIWVVSRADAGYPRRLKDRLREGAPPVIYCCGNIKLLETGGLAVVGSRNADDALIDYTLSVGQLAARAHKTIVSGGARGVDQAAMRGALEAGGNVCGVLPDSLEKAAMNSENRAPLLDGQLVLISPYDPGAKFSVGNAMQRNKLIYALADASLVVNADVNKGGTWAGASEQLDKLKYIPVFIRSTGEPSAGLDGLQKKGALLWPNPQDADSFKKVFTSAAPTHALAKFGTSELFSDDAPPLTDQLPMETDPVSAGSSLESNNAVKSHQQRSAAHEDSRLAAQTREAAEPFRQGTSPGERLFSLVREEIKRLLSGTAKKQAEIASALGVTNAQANIWLERLAEEGSIEKQKKPAGYIAKKTRLLE